MLLMLLLLLLVNDEIWLTRMACVYCSYTPIRYVPPMPSRATGNRADESHALVRRAWGVCSGELVVDEASGPRPDGSTSSAGGDWPGGPPAAHQSVADATHVARMGPLDGLFRRSQQHAARESHN